jgi:hypothetical protein
MAFIKRKDRHVGLDPTREYETIVSTSPFQYTHDPNERNIVITAPLCTREFLRLAMRKEWSPDMRQQKKNTMNAPVRIEHRGPPIGRVEECWMEKDLFMGRLVIFAPDGLMPGQDEEPIDFQRQQCACDDIANGILAFISLGMSFIHDGTPDKMPVEYPQFRIREVTLTKRPAIELPALHHVALSGMCTFPRSSPSWVCPFLK